MAEQTGAGKRICTGVGVISKCRNLRPGIYAGLALFCRRESFFLWQSPLSNAFGAPHSKSPMGGIWNAKKIT
ncbi:MAG: hypothetical protein Q7J52_26075 [Falsiroseomonas sp.]|nr:hypothetical protein [Falsiroseomonas sp.]